MTYDLYALRMIGTRVRIISDCEINEGMAGGAELFLVAMKVMVDLPAMVRCGCLMAVAGAVAEVKSEARFVTRACGGQAAVRESIEHILRVQDRWGEVADRYL